ncbi:MAG: ABC transporter permease [Caldilineaceae bacterium SB0664_bin_27]|uniref:ABC transporter permease n=1 Tax=Caldilineaceae bacterium SB0664_bin_27 TaxID=2605260 RepID=A0A6B0YN85_9CHLR|nr:ABC transporter permease [Caldilineaceae bacterium SB0664_bin_27]
MLGYTVRRILQFIPILIGLVTVLFALLNILPGDPARMMAGPFANPDVVETIREEMGFDRPLWVQYVDNLWNLARGEFGRSYQSRRPILKDLLEVFPKTVQLAIAAEVTSALIGVWLGIVAATRRNGWADRLIMTIAALNLSFPLFWLALMLQIVFAVFLRLLPPSGYGAGFDQFVILPAVTLALPSLGLLARITRAALLEVLGEDYIRTARAKGLKGVLVVRRHVLPNALIPIVTTIGTDFVRLLGGIPIIEVIFAWPGIGKYAYDALVFRDLPALQASVIVLAVSVSLVNLAVDLLYAFINPRIRYV